MCVRHRPAVFWEITTYFFLYCTVPEYANFLKNLVLSDFRKLQENQKKIRFNLTKRDMDIIYNIAQDISLIFKDADKTGK